MSNSEVGTAQMVDLRDKQVELCHLYDHMEMTWGGFIQLQFAAKEFMINDLSGAMKYLNEAEAGDADELPDENPDPAEYQYARGLATIRVSEMTMDQVVSAIEEAKTCIRELQARTAYLFSPDTLKRYGVNL